MTTTKKVSAKKATPAKKVSAKAPTKRGGVTKQKRVLARAEGAQCFWVTNGTILSDLVELRDALEHMEDEIFSYHVKGKRNDFANWIEFVLGDTELAAALRKTAKPKTMHTAVVRRLKIYSI